MSTAENYPVHEESFDVVLLKKGVSSLAAKPEDFKRVPVRAPSPLAAQLHDDVLKEKDFNVLFAAPPGVLTDPEIHARQRSVEAEVDRSKI